MSATVDKAVRFISKLVQLTQSGRLEWRSTDHPDAEAGSAALTSEINGQNLRLYRYHKEIENPDYGATFIFSTNLSPKTLIRDGVALAGC